MVIFPPWKDTKTCQSTRKDTKTFKPEIVTLRPSADTSIGVTRDFQYQKIRNSIIAKEMEVGRLIPNVQAANQVGCCLPD